MTPLLSLRSKKSDLTRGANRSGWNRVVRQLSREVNRWSRTLNTRVLSRDSSTPSSDLQQFFDNPRDVNLCRIQDGHSVVLGIFDDQRQLSSAKNQSFDAVALFHLVQNRQQPIVRFGQADAVHQFV